jgi:hypothetical protein
VQGDGVEEGLRGLDGVQGIQEIRPREGGRLAATLTAAADREVRPAIFQLAMRRGWTLYELHQAGRSLEDLFRELTAEADEPARPGESGGEARA